MNLNCYFDNFCGNWITKKSLYLLKNKVEKKYEEILNITNNNNQNVYLIDSKMNNNNNIDLNSYILNFNYKTITKITKTKIFYTNYVVQIISNNLFRIQHQIKKNQLIYTEYIYFVNQNLKTSFGFVKKNNKYILIIFTSYIKKIED